MPMGKTISFVKGKGSISHNNRDFIAENVDRNRTAWNVEYIKQPIREAYNQLFGEAIAEYNAKQKRKDRQVTDYLKDIKNSGNGEKQFYEIVVQIGKKDDTGVLDSEGNLSVDAKAASEILDEYARSFQERNPNLYLFNAVLHMDEATPHLHLDYIPVAHGYKTKMHTRNSLTKALQEMGIAPAVSKTDNETTHWQEREREYLKGLCLERGIEVEILGVKRDNYTIPEYKVAMRATEELTAELEILNAEKQEAESVIASVDAEIADAREEVEESKKHLDEINEQIADTAGPHRTARNARWRIYCHGRPAVGNSRLRLSVNHRRQPRAATPAFGLLLSHRTHSGGDCGRRAVHRQQRHSDSRRRQPTLSLGLCGKELDRGVAEQLCRSTAVHLSDGISHRCRHRRTMEKRHDRHSTGQGEHAVAYCTGERHRSQLAGVPCRVGRQQCKRRRRQDNGAMVSGDVLCCNRLRAQYRQHVLHTDGHAQWCRCEHRADADGQPDTRHHRQHRRRRPVCSHPLHHSLWPPQIAHRCKVMKKIGK